MRTQHLLSRWILLLTMLTAPVLLVAPFFFDNWRSFTAGDTSTMFAVVYFIGFLFAYSYPRFRYNMVATFFYWKRYVEYVYPLYRIPIRYSIGSLIATSLVVTVVTFQLVSSEEKWLIVITAFYASVLLFREVFSSDIPIIDRDEIRRMGGSLGRKMIFETDLGNIGSKIATDPRIEYRLYDLNGSPLTDRKQARPQGKNQSLKPGEWTAKSVQMTFEKEKLPKNIDTVYLHTKVYAGFGFALLAENTIEMKDGPSEGW